MNYTRIHFNKCQKNRHAIYENEWHKWSFSRMKKDGTYVDFHVMQELIKCHTCRLQSQRKSLYKGDDRFRTSKWDTDLIKIFPKKIMIAN